MDEILEEAGMVFGKGDVSMLEGVLRADSRLVPFGSRGGVASEEDLIAELGLGFGGTTPDVEDSLELPDSSTDSLELSLRSQSHGSLQRRPTDRRRRRANSRGGRDRSGNRTPVQSSIRCYDALPAIAVS